MSPNKILIPGIVGTSAMTIFSYLVSETKNRNFKEPEVLGQLIQRLPEQIPKEKALVAGWGLHYAIGIIFVALFHEYWKREGTQPTVASGSLLGIASGITGIVAWKSMFEAHPKPPAKNLTRFFGHLLLAHIVFGILSSIAYRLTIRKDR